jgi:hypothetical protein
MIRRLKAHLLLALILAGTAMVANGDDKIPPPDIRVDNFWPNPFGVNYTVTVNLKGMLNAKGVQNEQLKGDYTLEKLIPFINGVPVREQYPEFIDLKNEQVRFTLPFNENSRKAWLPVLGTSQQKVLFSVGWLASGPAPESEKASKAFDVKLSTFRQSVFWFVSLFLLIATVMLAIKTNLLRDKAMVADLPKDVKYTYSLGRSQMAWWFLIVLISFMYVWFVTGTWSLSTQALVLLGISGTTGLSSVLIDASKQQNAAAAQASLLAERVTDIRQVAAMDSAVSEAAHAGAVSAATLNLVTDLNQERLRLLQRRSSLLQKEAAPAVSHSNYFTDILSDANGISLNRFQFFVWTIVFGLMFGYTVITSLQMPTLDDKWLLLMGISGGTYLGFKFPTQK